MGVDISGRSPINRGTKPTINWDTATEEEKDKYFELNDAWQEKNPGSYFRASWWSWRPIVMLVDHVAHQEGLEIDTVSWSYNDGAGLESQEDCDALADALQRLLDANNNLTEEDDRIYLVMGSWCNLNGQFVSESELENVDLPPVGSIMYSSFITADGTVLQSSHSTSRKHLQQFINFLRECGGFQIF
jgi:hypothetical protein